MKLFFFARYNHGPRPQTLDIVNFFNNYGVVHHVNCPATKNYAFIFMASLNINASHRRTRSTISQIIHNMTPETRFHISVASSNREKIGPGFKNSNQYNPPRNYYNTNTRQTQTWAPKRYANYHDTANFDNNKRPNNNNRRPNNNNNNRRTNYDNNKRPNYNNNTHQFGSPKNYPRHETTDQSPARCNYE